jgi:hypothetical protein
MLQHARGIPNQIVIRAWPRPDRPGGWVLEFYGGRQAEINLLVLPECSALLDAGVYKELDRLTSLELAGHVEAKRAFENTSPRTFDLEYHTLQQALAEEQLMTWQQSKLLRTLKVASTKIDTSKGSSNGKEASDTA